MTRFAFASVIVTALSSFACSSGAETAVEVSPADTGGSDSDAVVETPSETGADTQSDSNDDAELPPIERTLGQVELATYGAADGGSERWSASASFRRVREPARGCETTVVGACYVIRCAGATSTTVATLDAGALTIERGRPGAPFPVGLTPDEDHRYAPTIGSGGAFVGGDALTFSAVGSSAFEPFSIAVTAPALLDAKLPSFEGTLGLDRSVPLIVSWSVRAGSDATGTAELAIDYAARATFVTCAWPVALGQAEVPPEVLGVLPRGGLGEIRLTSVATASNASTVHVRVSALGSTATGDARASVRFL